MKLKLLPILGITSIATSSALLAGCGCGGNPGPTPPITGDLFTEPKAEYKIEESWFTPDDTDETTRNDTTILFSGFKLNDGVVLDNITATCNTQNDSWAVRLYESGDFFDVFLYGHDITNAASLTSLSLSIHFEDTTTNKTQDCNNLVVNFDKNKGITTVGVGTNYYVHKVINGYDEMRAKTCQIKIASGETPALGFVLLKGNQFDPEEQVAIYTVDRNELTPWTKWPGPEELFDRTHLDKQTTGNNCSCLQVIDQNFNNSFFGLEGDERIYCILEGQD